MQGASVGVIGGEARKAGRIRTLQRVAGHCKESGLYAVGSGVPVRAFLMGYSQICHRQL